MHYSQTHFFETDEAVVDAVVRADQYLVHTFATAPSPFLDQTWWRILRLRALIACVHVLELMLGHTLFLRDRLGPLKALKPETLALLAWCTKRGYIKKWECNYLTPGQPHIAKFYLTPTAIKTPEGRRFNLVGATGNGSGQTLADASLPAIGEFVERYATSSHWWDRKDLVTHSVAQLRSMRASFVDPHALRIWRDTEDGPYGMRSRFDEHTSFQWVRGSDAFTRQSVYIPASVAYTFFTSAYKDEVILGETSSNGAAAHTTRDTAEYGALCELIERDAFLRTWYHKRKVSTLDLSSIETIFPGHAHVFKRISESPNMRLVILDITSDIRIPTLCVIFTNRAPGSHAVAVSSATDVDPKKALEKVLFEAVKFLHGKVPKLSDANKRELLKKFDNGIIERFNDRYRVWAQQETIVSIEWFLSERENISCDEFTKRYAPVSDHISKHKAVLMELKKKDIHASFIQFQNELTKRSGLTVVRAISPDIIPMFFTESNRPYNYQRFANREDGMPAPEQSIPHPFI